MQNVMHSKLLKCFYAVLCVIPSLVMAGGEYSIYEEGEPYNSPEVYYEDPAAPVENSSNDPEEVIITPPESPEQTSDDTIVPFSMEEEPVEQAFKEVDETAPKMPCKVTPELDHSFIPLGTIKKSSNLQREPGAYQRARGKFIHVKGTVVGEDCVPVDGAVIQMWQTDNAGKYEAQYQVNSEWDIQDKDYDPYFSYTGTAKTNNRGEFNFLTIFPGAMDKSPPHLNISVKRGYDDEELKLRCLNEDLPLRRDCLMSDHFDGINTRLFFNKHPRNMAALDLVALPLEKRQTLMMRGKPYDPSGELEGRVYEVNIVLRGIHQYKGF